MILTFDPNRPRSTNRPSDALIATLRADLQAAQAEIANLEDELTDFQDCSYADALKRGHIDEHGHIIKPR